MPGLKNKSKTPHPTQSKLPLVSIIIAAYNEQDHLPLLCKSITDQTYPHIETIVIDDSSTDGTANLARKFTKRVYTRPHADRSYQRNYGASLARGKYLLFLDADMQLAPDVVSQCVAKNADLVIIPEQSFGKNYWAKCKALERNCYIGDPYIEAARFVSQAAFVAVGGYNPDMIAGEDWDLHRRLSSCYPPARITSLIMHNESQLSFLKVIKKKLYYAQNSDEYLEKNITTSRQIIRFIVRPSIWRNWRFLLSDPLHLPGMLLLVWSEILVGGLGAIIYKPAFLRKLKT